jgi:hypothetical protein
MLITPPPAHGQWWCGSTPQFMIKTPTCVQLPTPPLVDASRHGHQKAWRVLMVVKAAQESPCTLNKLASALAVPPIFIMTNVPLWVSGLYKGPQCS